jgi:membrane protein implicated in regulation of membrane protease activity
VSEKRTRSKRWIWIVVGLVVLGVALFGLAVLSLVSVGSRAPASGPPAPTVVMEMAVEEVFVESEAAAPMEPGMDQALGSLPPSNNLAPVADRMIIRTGELSIVVEDTETALRQVRGVATGLNGYVSDANVWQVGDGLRGNVTIRVPADSFDTAMDQIKDLAVEVTAESVSAQDVTEEYTDLSARLRNLEATEEELLALLTEVREKTRRAEDVLAIHRELTRLTALATISVELIPEEEEKPIVEEGWQPLSTLRDASRSLVNAGQFLVDAAIWLIVFVLPVLLVLILPVVIVVYIWRRWRRRRAAEEE